MTVAGFHGDAMPNGLAVFPSRGWWPSPVRQHPFEGTGAIHRQPVALALSTCVEIGPR